MTLKGCEPEAPQVLTNHRDRAAKVARLVCQKRDDVDVPRAAQYGLAGGPVVPMLTENALFVALLRAIMDVVVGQGQPERPLIIAEAPRFGDEFARLTQRSKALIVKIVRQAVTGDR